MNWTEREVYKRLHRVFPAPAHMLIPQVRNTTGYAGKTRYCDALVVSPWPSRGLWLGGVEIKVTRSDWRRELADAEKAAEFAQWCNYWYIAAPAEIVPVNELPEKWGLIEVKATTAAIKVKAKPLKPKAPDLAMICALLRSFQESYTPNTDVDDKVAKQSEANRDSDKFALENLKEHVAEFEKASGVNITTNWNRREIGKAVKLVIDAGLVDGFNGLTKVRDEAQDVVKACNRILEIQAKEKPHVPPVSGQV